MEPTIFPIVAPALPGRETFCLEDSEDISGLARELIDGYHLGLLATVDESGRPHARWMATLSCDDFPRIVSLTAPNSRKVAHIRRHPAVEWMFSNQDLTLVLNLAGRARILDDPKSIKRAWRAARDKSHAYFLENFADKPGMVVIETLIDRIDGTIPQSALKFSHSVELAPPMEHGREAMA